MGNPLSLLHKLTVGNWQTIDKDWIEPATAKSFDWRPLIVFVTVCVSLTLQEYYGDRGTFFRLFPEYFNTESADLYSFCWLSGWRFFGYVILPILAILVMPGERVGDYFVHFRNVLKQHWIYFAFVALVLPVVLIVAQSSSFLLPYPMDELADRSAYNILSWLAPYMLQFLAVEFFYRGFMLKATAPKIGSAAIFVMLVPYCMIHFGQPMAETFAAIIAGTILGSLALRTSSNAKNGYVDRKSKAMGRPLSLLHKLTIGNWQTINKDWIEPVTAKSFDWRPLIVFVTVCVSLTLQEYYGDRGTFFRRYPEYINTEYGDLYSFAWWSGWRFFGYIVLPILAIMVMPGERIRDYFISFRNLLKHLWIYFALFALVLPAVLIAAQSDSFLKTYPFYKLANRSAYDFWMWQALYTLQFLSLEFFYRGFMLKATAPRLGSAAVFVMLVPYCMIHFGKPMAETFGAIIAGTVLGTLALRTRSIWGGVLIHVGVALTMDLMAVSNCPPAESGQPCPRH